MCSVTSDAVTLWTIDHQAPLSTVVFQARMVEWVAISSSRDLPETGIKLMSPPAPARQVDSLPLIHIGSPVSRILGFPRGSLVENPHANAGNMGLIPSSGRSLEEEMATHSSILAWKCHGQRSLAGYSSWGCKESDPT